MQFLSVLVALFLMAVLTSVPTAIAGDFAQRHIHGFSHDGNLFAFEEYGVQDGSGFPYSNIYVIDTATDKWVAGSPFRSLLKDETKTLFEARETSRIQAGPVLKSFDERGTIVATNRATETGIDRKRMAANPRLVIPPIDDTIEFRLETYPLDTDELCSAFGKSMGYRLIKIATPPSQITRILHEDRKIPGSRNCPMDYEFADLVTYYPDNGAPKVAIVILVKSAGFEGPNGRYLATVVSLETDK